MSWILNDPSIETASFETVLKRLLNTNSLLTLATVCPDGSPWANTAYFAFDDAHNLIIYTPPNTKHAANIAHSPRVAGTIFDSTQHQGSGLLGAQLTGTCRAAAGEEENAAFDAYASRYAWLAHASSSPSEANAKFESRLYVIDVDWAKLIDEGTFGNEVWVEGRR